MNWSLFQLDSNNTFSYDDYHENVYKAFLEGYFELFNDKIYQFENSLYCLKQIYNTSGFGVS